MVRPIFQLRLVGAVTRFVTSPLAGMPIFMVVMYAWHLPVLYDLALSNEGVHIVEHLSFMAFGVLAWWPECTPIAEQRLTPRIQTLCLACQALSMGALGLYFIITADAVYAPYAAAPRLWDLSISLDRELGGLVMLWLGTVPYILCQFIALRSRAMAPPQRVVGVLALGLSGGRGTPQSEG